MRSSVQKKIVFMFVILGLILVTISPAIAQSHAVGIINTGALNVRSGPDHTYPQVTTLYQGQQVSVLGRYYANHWVLIRTQSGVEGWANSSYMLLSVPLNQLPVIGGQPPPPPPPQPTPPPPQPTPPPQQQNPTAVVATGALNVRSGPGVNFAVITKVFNGQTVTMLARQANSSWVLIRTGSNVEGWVNGDLLHPSVPISSLPIAGGGTGGNPPPSTTGQAVVKAGALNLRQGPSPAFPVVTTVYNGTVLTVIARNHDNTWVYVQAPNGRQGWANVSFLNINIPLSNLPVKQTPGEAAVATVAVGALNMRLGPGSQFGTITTLTFGNEVIMIGRTSYNSPWVLVRTQSGTQGWVNSTYLTTNVPIQALPIAY